jgi:HlyD family secretion protein
MNDLVVLTAPEDGVVLDIAKRSVGSVLHEAEPLITLVPKMSPLIAEIMIHSADVGYTRVGDEVVIKVDAFPYQQHGLLAGRLRSIGEDSVTPGGAGDAVPVSARGAAGVFHRCQVTLTSTDLNLLPQGARLIPGMTITAEVKVGFRSVISYFLYPIQRGFDESIREP